MAAIAIPGFVARAGSVAEIEASAASPETKGVVWDRGEHACAAAMRAWLAELREVKKFIAVTGMSYAQERLVVNNEPVASASTASQDANSSSTDSDSGVCSITSDSDCAGGHDSESDSTASILTDGSDTDVDEKATAATTATGHSHGHSHGHGTACCENDHGCESFEDPAFTHPIGRQIKDASARLVASLPEPFRVDVRQDAEEIGRMMANLCRPNKKYWLWLKLEIVGKQRCSRWHQDNYIGRAIVTYVGSGTWLADDVDVRFSEFMATRGMSFEQSDPRIVPEFEKIHRTPTNSVVLMKGNQWPGIRGYPKREGLTHKSPNVKTDTMGNPNQLRLLLKVDVEPVEPNYY